ncbi:DUF3578 domain-containing protein [Bacteroides caecigallinarum]|uniref:MrcB family domain-containing protein n=1 Tax=Bacteroides caecigallinarum TaxID=1411144 RepID=UPI0019574C4A|nr:DUF3578 domain-containing protein [Bacteroides caecigallinarum]MBM6959857.1 DUF3578 domain-containing protein [Bacteroides caecigallinarum]
MIINDINFLFRKVFAKADSFNHAEKTSDIDKEASDIICHQLPSIFNNFLGKASINYTIKGSVGVGRATKTPWIAIMDKDITHSTREGVYLVFLLSTDYKHVYLTLNQGTTVPGQFGPRLGIKDITKNTLLIRGILNKRNEILKQDGNANIADERYKAGAIYYTLWNIEDEEKGLKLLNLYLEIYQEYKEAKYSEKTLMTNNINKGTIVDTKFRSYITAIKTKPFLLLAGISGTGKSRIVRELARACWNEDSIEYKAQKPKNFEIIQVKPNWHDSTELIGYVSRVSGTPVYVIGDFLRFITQAWENLDVPYFLCLDEMNLAPVEQYFAEFLSVIESRKSNEDGTITTDPILKKSTEDWYRVLTAELTGGNETLRKRFLEEGITIPQNLIVMGTVNMDETTFSFSRKVLDRAMTIEMNEVDLYAGLDSKYERIGKLNSDMLIGTAVEGVDVYADNEEVCNKVLSYLQAVNDVLNGTPFKIAYRTRNEFLLYVVNNLPYNLDEKGNEFSEDEVIAIALDEITSMKILSRIEGDNTKFKDSFFEKLMTTIETQLLILTGEEKKIESISVAKLKDMKERLISSGYTSFWS